MYEERKRYTCTGCGKRFYDNNNPTECRFCQKSFDENTKVTVDQRLHPLVNQLSDGQPVPGKSKKATPSIMLKDAVKMLEKELDKIVITDDLFEVCKKRLLMLWEEENKKFKTARKTIAKEEEELEDEADNLRREKLKKSSTQRDRSDADRALDRVEEDLQRLADKKIALKEELKEKFEMAWIRLQTLRDAKTIFSKNTQFEPKKELLLSLSSNLKIDKGFLEVEWRFPFDIIASANIDKNKKLALRPV